MKKRTVFKTQIAGFDVKLEQTGFDHFIVTYGKQVETSLTYCDAAAKLGEAIMHACVCDGKINSK